MAAKWKPKRSAYELFARRLVAVGRGEKYRQWVENNPFSKPDFVRALKRIETNLGRQDVRQTINKRSLPRLPDITGLTGTEMKAAVLAYGERLGWRLGKMGACARIGDNGIEIMNALYFDAHILTYEADR